MGNNAPFEHVALSLLPHVKDPNLAEWLLSQTGKLSSPVRMTAKLSPSQVKSLLKGKVNHALTAAWSCEDLDALHLCARDSRVSVKRLVAAAPELRQDTLALLAEYAIAETDVEVFGPLLSKLPLDWLIEHATMMEAESPSATAAGEERRLSERARRVRSMLVQADRISQNALFDRVVASGDWKVFSELSGIAGRAGFGARSLQDVAAARLGRTDRGHGGLDLSAEDENAFLCTADLPLDAIVPAFRFIDSDRARWLVEVVSRSSKSVADGDSSSRRHPIVRRTSVALRPMYWERGANVSVDDDAADILVSELAGFDPGGSNTARFAISHALSKTASDPRQADRHFSALVACDDPSTVATLASVLSDGGGLSRRRQHALVKPLSSMELVNIAGVVPASFGAALDFEDQIQLLSSGNILSTLEWLTGSRFCKPDAEKIGELVRNPGTAFDAPPFHLRNDIQTRSSYALWQDLPSAYVGGSQPSAGVVDWFLSVHEQLDGDAGLASVRGVDAADALRSLLSESALMAIVDAAGGEGVQAALKHPSWFHDRASERIGDSQQVWEALLKLIPGWDQSMTELLRTAAILTGSEFREDAGSSEEDAGDASLESRAGDLEQLSLL